MSTNTLTHRTKPSLLTGLIATGTTQATALVTYNNACHEFGTVASSSGAVLPIGDIPSEVSIFNGGVSSLAVYPPLGGSIDGGSINASISVATLSGVTFWAAGPLTWHSLQTGGTGGGGSGTVTSIVAGAGLTGGTISTSGTIALANPSASTLGGVQSITAVSHNFLTSISTSGVPAQAQPAFTDISGSVTAAQLPNPSASTLGGVESIAAVSHNFLTSISTSGVPAQAQPAFTDISGTATVAQLPTVGLTVTQAYQAISAPADGATITFDLSAADLFKPAALGGNRTLALSNAPTVSPWAKFTIILTQDGTGSRTVTWFSGIKWAGGVAPTLTTPAGGIDVFTFLQVASGSYYGFVAGQSLA
jgi:hypothetical protein